MELYEVYKNKSDHELMRVIHRSQDYTPEALEVVNRLIDERGGYAVLNDAFSKSMARDEELINVTKQVQSWLELGEDARANLESLDLSYLSANDVEEVLVRELDAHNLDKEDKTTTKSSLSRAILGGLLSSILGGIIWAAMVGTGRIWYIVPVGMFLLSQLIVSKISGKSIKNTTTAFISFFSVLTAALLGQAIYEIAAAMGFFDYLSW